MVNVDIGQNIKLEIDERVIIDCGPLIDAIEVTNVTINWIHNSLLLPNVLVPNVVISQDERQCIITETLWAAGGQLGNGGNYTCKVCSDLNTCMSNSTIIDACG